ncbi:TonB-dependent siderophore receptor PiuA [Colwellia asteriadis]|uniref:TonB-dependent siderophore receptor PiuA n=1 Tax=Colwellia asteriadis TaxID=517723 RepID=A0ABN1L481_9GAMM
MSISNRFTRSILSKAVALAATTLALNAYAEAETSTKSLAKTTVSSESSSEFKKEKVSNHKITTSLLDTAKTISVIDAKVLSNQGVTSLNDALRNVTGVSTFGAGEGGGGNVTTSDKITIRGFSANGNIYIDGIRDITGYSRDLFNTEQVEVSKGASSSITGKGSAGGTVNMVTKKATLDDFANVNALLDDADTKRLTADINTKLGDSNALRINGLVTDGGDPLDNGIETYQTLAIAPSIYHEFSERTNITADVLLMKQDNTPTLGLPYISEEAGAQIGMESPLNASLWDKFYGNKQRDFEEVNINVGTVVIEHQFSDTVSLVNQTRFASNDKKSVTARPMIHRTSYDRDTQKSTYANEYDAAYTLNIDSANTLFVNQFDVLANFATGSVDHNLVVGVELYQEEQKTYNLANDIVLENRYLPIDQPNPYQGYTGSIYRDGAPSEVEGTGAAIYALDTITFNEQWLLTVGARFEDYKAEGSAYQWKRVNDKWVRELKNGLAADSTFTSWNSALNYKPTEQSSIYVSFANSQDPAAGDMAFPRREAESELDPQESINFELGAKIDLFDGNLQLATAYFSTTKTVTDRNDKGETFLSGEQEATGFELSVNGMLNENFSILAGYTHQDTEVTKDFTPESVGNGLSAAPENSANIWLQYQQQALTLALGAQYSSGNTYWRRNTAYYETGSSTILQAMAAYQVTKALQVQFNVDNLTDEEYVTDYSARGHFRPGAPRVMKLSATYAF